ncbi:MAG: glycoside hydrolase family 28, partial [Sphingobacteriaceae bacterium]
MKKLNLILLLILFKTAAFSQKKIYNIVTYGAKADGITNNTSSIQKAINAAAIQGGVVLIPAGNFVTGVIYLKSNIELQLVANARLMATTKRIDYGSKKASALIVADDAHDVSITGKGVIDGQAAPLLKDIYRMLNNGTLEDAEWKKYNDWGQMRPAEDNRPHIIDFTNCSKINIKGITIRDGLCWIQDYINCSNMVIDSITVESNTFLNNDGIDLVDCKNVK